MSVVSPIYMVNADVVDKTLSGCRWLKVFPSAARTFLDRVCFRAVIFWPIKFECIHFYHSLPFYIFPSVIF